MNYARPTTIDDAVTLLRQPAAHGLGGGTDALVALREGILRAETFVDLRALAGSHSIEAEPDGSVRIGASCTIAAIAAHPAVRERFPALAQACDAVGSPALRNMGTLGGNLCQRPRCPYFRAGFSCHKSGGDSCPAVDGDHRHLAILGSGPCRAVHPSDTAVALLALGAMVHTQGPDGPRAIPVDELFSPPAVDATHETALGPAEFITAVSLPPLSSGARQRFAKVLQRGAWDFALASVAVVRRADGAVRIVLGGVAPAPWRINPSVEEDVAAAPLAGDDLDALADRALHDARPLADNGWKVTVASALLREAFAFASAP